MRTATAALLAVLLASLLAPLSVSAQEAPELTLRMLGESPRTSSSGDPVLVAGLWHELAFQLASPLDRRLEVEVTHLDATAFDLTSHYLWIRDEVNDTWGDPLYGLFVDAERSVSDGEHVSFVAGMDAAAMPGIWRLVVRQDGSPVTLTEVEVEAPHLDYGLSAADFQFRGEPFQSVLLTSEDAGQYLRVRNGGNVPLQLTVSFDKLQDRLALTNPARVAHPGDDVRYHLRLDLDPRPPQILAVQGVSRVEVPHRIPSSGAATLVPAVEGTFSVTLTVGRSGYAVRTVGSVVFQTLEALQADYGSTLTWQVFLTGDQSVVLDVEVRGARLAGVVAAGALLDLPAALVPSPEREMTLTVQVVTDVPDTTAEVVFTLRLQETGEVRTFRTAIQVGPRPATGSFAPSYLWLLAATASASVLVLVSYNQWRYETRGPAKGPRNRGRSRKGREGRGNRSEETDEKDASPRQGRRGGPSKHGRDSRRKDQP